MFRISPRQTSTLPSISESGGAKSQEARINIQRALQPSKDLYPACGRCHKTDGVVDPRRIRRQRNTASRLLPRIELSLECIHHARSLRNKPGIYKGKIVLKHRTGQHHRRNHLGSPTVQVLCRRHPFRARCCPKDRRTASQGSGQRRSGQIK